MKMKAFGAACLAIFSLVPAQAAIIDFEDIAPGTVFTAPLVLPGATFSSQLDGLRIDRVGGGNTICSLDGNVCNGPLIIDFAEGVRNLTLTFAGDTDPLAQIRIAGEALATFDGEPEDFDFAGVAFADGDPLNEQLIDLRFRGDVSINSVALIPSLSAALSFDNISFEPSVSAVPEPATWAMMLLGFGATGTALRRRRRLALA